MTVKVPPDQPRRQAPSWHLADDDAVPPGDEWLHPLERRVQAQLRRAPRRRTWRLGRWAAKQVILRTLERASSQAHRFAIIAAEDGAPEIHEDDRRLPWSLSLSHREHEALACLAPAPVGCDLERIEPRSPGFVETFFTDKEKAHLRDASDLDRALALAWCAKEAVLKLRRTGLRRDTRSVEVLTSGELLRDDWQTLAVMDLDDEGPIHAWARRDRDRLMVIASAASVAPRPPQGPRR